MSNLKDMSNAIRFLSMDAVQKANSGHPGMPMGMADVATVLWSQFLKFDPAAPRWEDRDRFVLSAGHGSMLLYSLLYLTGYKDCTLDDLKKFRQLGSKTAGHPEYGLLQAIETTTGPLGQGLATAVGMALAEQKLSKKHGRDVVDHHTYVLAGDGCLMEGISYEASAFAGHHQLHKLIVLWDNNHITIDGSTSLATSEDQLKRFEAAGWRTLSVNGHDYVDIERGLSDAQDSDRPVLIACQTTIGYGAPHLAGSEKTHGAPLGDEEIAATRKNLSWSHSPFDIPQEILSSWHEVGQRHRSTRETWEKKNASFVRSLHQEHLTTAQQALHDLKKAIITEKSKDATRRSSQRVLSALAPHMPHMIGGSADLTGSNLTKVDGLDHLNYGVREHAMGAIMNGLSLHGGFRPYGGTFFVFTDYLKPALRLSALMKQPVIYVMTHDSIGLGEDGPTHQPIEHLASVRALPNTLVFRPCDGVETAECWELALQTHDAPSVLCLSRQGLPTVRSDSSHNLSAYGAYVLSPSDDQNPKVSLLATGSEVSLALDVQKALAAQHVSSQVVSMPCWALFEKQSPAYQQKTLGNGLRVSIEAGSTFGWDRYASLHCGIDTFGESAPAPALYQHFDLTSDAITAKILKTLG